MKFLKNKVVQILSVIMLIAIIGVITYSLSDTNVKADDTVTMKYVNDKFGELQTQINTLNTTIEEQKTQINTLNTTIEEQKTQINTLKSTNEDLKVKIDKLNYAEDIKGINNSITTINSKISKINAREDYFYEKGAYPNSYLPRLLKYINENLK